MELNLEDGTLMDVDENSSTHVQVIRTDYTLGSLSRKEKRTFLTMNGTMNLMQFS